MVEPLVANEAVAGSNPVFRFMEKMNYVGVILSIYCDNLCVFCQNENFTSNNEKLQKDLVNMYKNLLNHYETSSVKNLTISGADPINYKGLPEFISLAKQIGYKNIRIETHGNELSNFEFAKSLREAGAEKLLVPIYGHTAELHDRITMNPGSFDKLVQGIKNSVELGYKPMFHTSLFTNNINHIKTLYDFLAQLLKRDHLFQIRTICIVDEAIETLGPVYVPLKDMGDALNTLLDIENIEVADIPYCVIGRYHENMLSTSPPDIGTQQSKFKSEVKNLPSYRIKIYPPICDSCSLRDKCGGFYKNDYDKFGVGDCKAL